MSAITASQRALGAFYTPPDVARMMAAWALAGGATRVLEPSFGDGVFVSALRDEAASRGVSLSITGVELSPEAFGAFADWTSEDRPILSDFHAVQPSTHDAVVGNPPFVRFRHLTSDLARNARAVGSEALGQPIDESGSTWMTFTLHATRFLAEGGRLGLVLPNDATYVRYGTSFWTFLGNNFSDVRVLRSRERIFGDLLQDVILLLASGFGGRSSVVTSEVFESHGDLIRGRGAVASPVSLAEIASGERPFVKALAGPRLSGVLSRLSPHVVRAGEVLKFSIGYVDAAKTYFHPSHDAIREFRLPSRSLRLALRSGRHWIGAGLRTSDSPLDALTQLWLPDPSRLTLGERRYIEYGESIGIHTGHKTSRRKPWFVVPGVEVPDVIVPVFADRPRIMLNDGQLVVSNSLMAASWRAARNLNDAIALGWHSSVAQLGVELAVHSLGGGVLVLVPRECSRIILPRLEFCRPSERVSADLELALSQGSYDDAAAIADSHLARCGWNAQALTEAREMAAILRSWRVGTR